MPTEPARTTLAKPSATPPTTAVPQSGPMTSTFAAAAASLRRTSSSTGTLSEKTMTEMPARTASRASVTAYSPGTETSARSAPERRIAPPRVRACGAAPSPPEASAVERVRVRAPSSAASPASIPEASPRIAMMRSFGEEVGTSKPIPWITSRLSSVAIATCAASTPGVAATVRETCIRVTESR